MRVSIVHRVLLTSAATVTLFSACKREEDKPAMTQGLQAEAPTRPEPVVGKEIMKAGKISLHELVGSPAFTGAKLALEEPSDKHYDNSVPFAFSVKNFELGAQTQSPVNDALASSKDGQHIHVVLNDRPYMARYTDKFDERLDPGRYLAVAFLSRSYHESVKSPGAFAVTQFTVGDTKGEPFDVEAPHLVYSRPKGSYEDQDADAVLLDFYLLNTKLSETGNKVVATIAGESVTITKWQPYILQGLPDGEVEVRLQLVDADGKLIPGPFNDSTHKITIKRARSS